ncbi:conserved hypothetical protein [Desulfonatronospira thiodismutans ASO3-1]|uniref:CopG antitoxin of type II toxin-antitoxin system n=1 Tax=Desulfonatronospira thiodismutans ASO3-1 TaxID=555779 RepID=D6SRQ9_9BACT|nr:CopG family antitoxin [Desulfonatronospira thiodismutans]EFI33375.1 conserved hypothetical protein [Desulfonatronospira thiodismutans ASO3-1]
MKKNEYPQKTSISQADSLEAVSEFWDTHSLAEYWNETSEVHLEVRAEQRRRITLDPDIFSQVESQARSRGLLPQTLVNMWVAERLSMEKDG